MEGVSMADLLENYRRVLDGVKQAALEAGRDPAQVRLLAVSKTFPAEDIRTVFEAGQLRFGENKVQELQSKVPVLPAEIEWHLIGHLQSNKAAKAAECAQWIHSVDSVHLAQKIGNAAARLGKKSISCSKSISPARKASSACIPSRIPRPPPRPCSNSPNCISAD